MASRQVHVVYCGSDWKVEYEGRACSYHFTKDTAICAGRSLAQQVGAELIVYAVDGSIDERMWCTHEPLPLATLSSAHQ